MESFTFLDAHVPDDELIVSATECGLVEVATIEDGVENRIYLTVGQAKRLSIILGVVIEDARDAELAAEEDE